MILERLKLLFAWMYGYDMSSLLVKTTFTLYFFKVAEKNHDHGCLS